jgi:N-acetylmuramate 1-kinase
MVERENLARAFLQEAGWGGALRQHLAGDASDRRYERLSHAGTSAVLMDSPPGTADDPASFIQIADHLCALGLSAPRILARDLAHGFLLLEDLGDDLFARILKDDPDREPALYRAATDVLLHLQRQESPAGLPNLTASDWAEAASLALESYAYAVTGERPNPAGFVQVLGDTLSRHADGPRVLILRDYHAENLLWLPDRQGLAKVGLLDFQLAQMGQPGYDLVSLLQDARRDVSPETEAAQLRYFAQETGQSLTAFSAAYATLGAQRALRIIGIFAKLCIQNGKPSYLSMIPRVWQLLQHNLTHPALAELAQLCSETLPAPTPGALRKIEDRCQTNPSRF